MLLIGNESCRDGTIRDGVCNVDPIARQRSKKILLKNPKSGRVGALVTVAFGFTAGLWAAYYYARSERFRVDMRRLGGAVDRKRTCDCVSDYRVGGTRRWRSARWCLKVTRAGNRRRSMPEEQGGVMREQLPVATTINVY